MNTLELVDNGNLDSQMKKIKNLIKNIEKSKNILKSQFGRDELHRFNKNFHDITKQIVNKFDDIIESKKFEQDFVGNELKKAANRKKLIKYI